MTISKIQAHGPSKAFVESITAVTQQDFPYLVRSAYLSIEERKCLSNLTCQEEIICTEPTNYFKEGKYQGINASKRCFTSLR